MNLDIRRRVKQYSGETIFTVLFTLLMGLIVVETLDFPYESRLTPIVIAVPTFVILLIILASEISDIAARIRVATSPKKTTIGDVPEISEVDPAFDNSVRAFLWTVGLFIGFFLFGMRLFTPVFMFLFLTKETGLRARWGVVYSLVFTAITLFLFDIVLSRGVYDGWIIELLLG